MWRRFIMRLGIARCCTSANSVGGSRRSFCFILCSATRRCIGALAVLMRCSALKGLFSTVGAYAGSFQRCAVIRASATRLLSFATCRPVRGRVLVRFARASRARPCCRFRIRRDRGPCTAQCLRRACGETMRFCTSVAVGTAAAAHQIRGCRRFFADVLPNAAG